RKLQWPSLPEKGDGRRGPRVWEWSGPADAARLAPPQLWLTPEARNNFPPARFNTTILGAAAGGMPSERHPMQYVSAQGALYYAAALGCRLPTSAEWR